VGGVSRPAPQAIPARKRQIPGARGQRPRIWNDLFLTLPRSIGRGGLGTPAPRTTFEDVAVMEQTIQHGADGGHVGQ